MKMSTIFLAVIGERRQHAARRSALPKNTDIAAMDSLAGQIKEIKTEMDAAIWAWKSGRDDEAVRKVLAVAAAAVACLELHGGVLIENGEVAA